MQQVDCEECGTVSLCVIFLIINISCLEAHALVEAGILFVQPNEAPKYRSGSCSDCCLPHIQENFVC